jgi:cation transport ATPase
MSAPHLIERNPANGPQLHGSSHPQDMKEPEASEHSEHEHRLEWTELARIAFVALAAVAVWFRVWEPFPHISVIGIVAALIGGYPIFKEAFENIVERKMTMELSMTIALLSALAIGEFFTALVITGFVLAAEVLEGLTVGSGRPAFQRRWLHLIGKSHERADKVPARPRSNQPVVCSDRLFRSKFLWGFASQEYPQSISEPQLRQVLEQ